MEKSYPAYKGLSGAGRKRFWRYVKLNVPVEEAFKLAGHKQPNVQLDESVVVGIKSKQPCLSKESNGNSNVGPGNNIGTVKVGSNKTKKVKRLPPLFPSTLCYEELDVVSQVQIHNIQSMSEEQMKMVHEALLHEIANEETTNGPRFHEFSHMAGWILVKCEDYYSQNWLAKVVHKIKPWPEADLVIKIISEPVTAITFLPASEADTIEKAFKLIGIQNKGLNTEDWKVLDERDYEGGRVVTFSMDIFSMKALKEYNFKLILGFKNIFLKLLPNVKSKDMAENTEPDVEMEEQQTNNETIETVPNDNLGENIPETVEEDHKQDNSNPTAKDEIISECESSSKSEDQINQKGLLPSEELPN